MKKAYMSPACVRVGTRFESHLLAGTQGNWADAKEHKFRKDSDDPWKTGVWDGQYERHSPYDD